MHICNRKSLTTQVDIVMECYKVNIPSEQSKVGVLSLYQIVEAGPRVRGSHGSRRIVVPPYMKPMWRAVAQAFPAAFSSGAQSVRSPVSSERGATAIWSIITNFHS